MWQICKILLLFALLNVVLCQDLFDYSEVSPDNYLAYVWNNKNSLVQDRSAPCTVPQGVNSAQVREGTCMNAAQCRFSRGRSAGRGSCSFWNTCCVFEKTSNQTSDARVTYFVNPQNARTLPQAQRLYIRIANRNVCQLRIDINSMQLAPSTIQQLGTTMRTRTCVLDNFFIEPFARENRIPEICGTNNNQHLYVHLTPNQILNNAIILNVRLDTMAQNLPEPRWDIKITQLECPTRQRPFDVKSTSNPNQAADDFNRLAPAGCLQYFTQPSGIIKNFGYDSPTATFLNTDQDYAMCFKRLPNSCGVDFTATTLTLHGTDCMNEFIEVPSYTQASGTGAGTPPANGRTCMAMQYPARTTHPGPLYIRFFSNQFLTTDETANTFYGFALTYRNNVACS